MLPTNTTMLVSIENSYLLNNKDVLLVNNKKKLVSFFIPETYNQITSNTATNIAAIALSLCNVKLILNWFAGRIFFTYLSSVSILSF